MPDGRVWTWGSNHDGLQGRANLEPRIEIINPPYIKAPSRPAITSAAARMTYGSMFSFMVQPARSCALLRLRMGSAPTSGTSGSILRLATAIRSPSKARQTPTLLLPGAICCSLWTEMGFHRLDVSFRSDHRSLCEKSCAGSARPQGRSNSDARFKSKGFLRTAARSRWLHDEAHFRGAAGFGREAE
jgi:hypothetical protein